MPPPGTTKEKVLWLHGQNFFSKNRKEILVLLPHLRTLDSSVSNNILNRIPTDIRVWKTALMYFERGITNSDGLALQAYLFFWSSGT
jgi:hypothetical protein